MFRIDGAAGKSVLKQQVDFKGMLTILILLSAVIIKAIVFATWLNFLIEIGVVLLMLYTAFSWDKSTNQGSKASHRIKKQTQNQIEMQRLNETVERQSAKIENCRINEANLRKRNKKLDKEINDLKNKVNDHIRRKRNDEETINTLRRNKKEDTHSLKSLRKDLQEAMDHYAVAYRLIQAKDSHISRLEWNRQKELDKYKALLCSEDFVRRQLEAAQAEVKTLKEQNESSMTQVEDLKEQVAIYKERVIFVEEKIDSEKRAQKLQHEQFARIFAALENGCTIEQLKDLMMADTQQKKIEIAAVNDAVPEVDSSNNCDQCQLSLPLRDLDISEYQPSDVYVSTIPHVISGFDCQLLIKSERAELVVNTT